MIQPIDAPGHVGLARDLRPLQDRPRRVERERVVHQEQGLGGDGGGAAARAGGVGGGGVEGAGEPGEGEAGGGGGGVGGGKVEGGEERGGVEAVDGAVGGRGGGGGDEKTRKRRPADAAVEPAGDGQQGVAGGLEVEAATIHPPVEGILVV